MKVKQIVYSVMAALPLILPFVIYAETERVGDYTWQYFVRDGKAWIESQQAEVAAIFPKPVGEVTVPSELGGYEVVGIGESSFYKCYEMVSVKIPETTKHIGNHAFMYCTNLTEVTVPASVETVGAFVFSYCKNLKKITLPFIGSCRGNSGTEKSVFGYVFGRTSATGLIKVVQVYDEDSSLSCYIPASLQSVMITDETIISTGAFQNCSNLTSVVIGNSVTNIAKGAFSGCGALESMTLPFTGKCRDALEWNVDHCECSLGYIFGSDSYQGSVGVKAYGSNGFSYYYLPAKLASITVIGTERIRSYAFYNCTMLTNVTIDANAKSIGYQTFGNCTGLKRIEIPYGVQSFGSNTFRGSGLEIIQVPLSVTGMTETKGANFQDCTSLHLAYIPRRFKGRLPESTFQNCASDLQVIYYDENMKFLDETLTTEDNSSTNLVAVCTNDCRVSFKWKCSCEPMIKSNPYDYLSFEIDGVRQDFICGETDWQMKSYEVSGDGEHLFRWTYQKDAEGAEGEDCAWVKQVVVAPRVTLSFDDGEATYGVPPAAMSFYADDESAVLPECGTLSLAKHSFAGWSDGETVYTAGMACPYQKTAQTLTAVWAANELSAPVIVAPETYEADYATVTVTVADEATIYYTLDGSEPSADGMGCRLYQGPFEIEGSATIRAIAVRDNYYDSEIASFTVTRPTWTFGEYLNCPERTFTTGGDAEWGRAKGVSDDGYALRSGGVGNSQTSRLETVVYGAGTIEFRCKVDGEVVKKIVFDGLAFCIDGVQQGDLMGENAWTDKSFAVTGGGRHTLSWLYVKDEDGSGGGEDRAWLDNVVWTANDALPALDGAATDNDAKAIIGRLLDTSLLDEIDGTAAYTTFRSWVDGKALSHTLVKDAPNAWLSYALDAPGLMAKATALASEDVVIESIEPSSAAAGAFDLVVNIADAELGEGARLAEALGVEGTAELDCSAFSFEGLSVMFDRTADGKAKATVTPDGAQPTFFLRVRVK